MKTILLIQIEKYTDNILILILIALVISIGVWLLMRPVVLWYFKIDKTLDLLHEIKRAQDNREPNRSNSNIVSANRINLFDENTTEKKWKCPKCSHLNNNNTYQCSDCSYKLI